ncbi:MULTISPECIES: dTDP-4-dehydrorhamnose reductase [unclassified Frigoribacterium]|uniref:dTDP-4-dehydrorhamnose reductase n=1 Tax=unclassified Frigoribacterium TaxID=2627005 RepID=UPI00156301F7|nr:MULTISPECIES: dTDP-4-dehydrorhamnose reductase [unclassified Frigoribacterium]NQW86512.1 dTDP-4-dehydrorhamnose reductase [Frigoribacterium sp. VKM Ac-2860]NQX07843.1 dTDP-4-dehydrorhamnose reductase [Frigoribacterium sp. VKM Ac-2859]
MAAPQNSKYLVTGARGMLGTDLLEALFGRDVTVLGRADLDVTDRDAVFAAVEGHDVVINAAAYTAVDAAETDEEAALAVNGTAAGLLAEATASVGAKLVQVSTDYVFDGDAATPYAEDATIAPVSAYGRTKAEGEKLALAANPEGTFVVRTAWLYGAHGGNFAKTMVKLAGSHDTVKVVDDQLGQPTWTADLAAQIVALLDSDAPAGVYHGTNSGSTSWFEFARAVFDEAGLDPARVLPTDSSTFVRPAPRPSYSVLGHDAWGQAGLAPMRPWREALAEAASRGVLQTDDHAASSR